MKVLSLFDGISCGRVALERAGIPVEKYYASEIDKYAMQVSAKNWPDIEQIGSVCDVDFTKYHGIDLLIGGSPCQGFSFAGKQLNFDDPRSKLFFEFVRALKESKPKYFLLENVKMKKEFQDVISEQLGVKPIEVNSSLVSAQNRRRLYWTNIPVNCLPEDKNIMLKDIVLENTITDRDKSLCLLAGYDGKFTPKRYFEKHIHQALFDIIAKYIVPFDKTLQILEKEVEKGKVGFFRKDSQANRVYFIHDKAITLCGDAGGGAAKMGQYLFGNIELRVPEATKKGYATINPGECVDMTFPNSKTRRGRKMADKCNCLTASNYDYCLFGCITPDRIEKRQNGQRFSEGKKFYTLTAQDQHGILIEGYIRKLTPIECERLQTLPDNYTAGISDSQRYKSLGNGWTADIIAHIFSFIPKADQ